jgi:GH15 family glucan-1,4-alpha-glucosidase
VVLASTQLFFDERLLAPGDTSAFARLEPLGERAWALHDQPDAGLWEFRGRAAVHTYSAAMCWAACDRLARIARKLGLHDRAAAWRDRADAIRARIDERAWNQRLGHFVDAFDGERLDASLLLLEDIGFVAADDPRYVATVEAVRRKPASPSARSGTSTRSRPSAAKTRRGNCSNACSRGATTSACCRRTWRWTAARPGAISRRPIRTSAS